MVLIIGASSRKTRDDQKHLLQPKQAVEREQEAGARGQLKREDRPASSAGKLARTPEHVFCRLTSLQRR